MNCATLNYLFDILLILIGTYLIIRNHLNKKLPRGLTPVVIGILLILIGLYKFLFEATGSVNDAVMAFSTFTLAVVAAFTLIENNKLRKDSKEKEERDRKERALIDIIDWAKRLQTIVTSFKYKSINTLPDILSELQSIKAEQTAFIKIGKNISTELTDFILLKRPDNFVPKNPQDNLLDTFITDIEELSENLPKLITDVIINDSPMTLIKSIYLDERYSHLGIKAIETVLFNKALTKIIENASSLRAELIDSISKPTSPSNTN
jgi:hypothetical protein